MEILIVISLLAYLINIFSDAFHNLFHLSSIKNLNEQYGEASQPINA